MNPVIVGSAGCMPGINRTPKDIDIIGTYEDLMTFIKNLRAGGLVKRSGIINKKTHGIELDEPILGFGHARIVEWEIAWKGSSAEEFLQKADRITFFNNEFGLKFDMVDSADHLALKLSHRYLKNSPHFLKTMDDINTLRERVRLHEWHYDFIARREAETYDYSHPSLKQSKGDFFNTEGVVYKYDHDSIHRAVAIGSRPAYEEFKDDSAEVFCSRVKFACLDFDTQIDSVREECFVLALERCLIPFNFNTRPQDAYNMALEKVCTSISSGWWREFAWENYYHIKDTYDGSFVEKFMDGLYNGTIKEV